MSIADLHVHSTFSDGTLTIRERVVLSKELSALRGLHPNHGIDALFREAGRRDLFVIAAHPLSTGRMEAQTYYLWDNRERLADRIDAWECSIWDRRFEEVERSGLPIIAHSDLHSRGLFPWVPETGRWPQACDGIQQLSTFSWVHTDTRQNLALLWPVKCVGDTIRYDESMATERSQESLDFVIIGSGFGGAVSAMRLAQKGYRVAILESGKRWRPQDFAQSNWNIFKYLWFPIARCFGIQNITLLKGVMILHGAGVGGGSLVYANTLMKPRPHVFHSGNWPEGVHWEEELAAHYETARKMLGVATNPFLGDAEESLRVLGRELGVEATFHPTEVGVYFGAPGKKGDDPYFNGQGPDRAGCNQCGGCMVGCRFDAKNTLDKNYLYFAEKWGATIHPETTVVRITPRDEGYEVETRITTSLFSMRRGHTFRAKRVIVAAGVIGTLKLLLQSKLIHQTLPKISDELGKNIRTNGESLLGATSFDTRLDFSKGIAIGAAIHPDHQTKIESVKYPSGSNFMKLLAVPLTGSGNRLIRPLKLLRQVVLRLPKVVRLQLLRDWAKQTIILLVMQSTDQKIRLGLQRRIFPWGTRLARTSDGESIPSFLTVAQDAAQKLADQLGGEAQNVVSEVVLATPATAHILGGACMGTSSKNGVIDLNHEVFGHPGLYVCDGSVVSANLGVNPSLTITALAERFAQRFEILNPALFQQRQIRYSSCQAKPHAP